MCRSTMLTHNAYTRRETRKYDKKFCYTNRTNPGNISSFDDITYIHGDGTTDTMLNYMTSDEYGVAAPWVTWLISFTKIPGQGGPGEAGDWDYSIHMNFTFAEISTGNTAPIRPLFHGLQTWHQNNYAIEGFNGMQAMVDRYIIHRKQSLDAASVLSVSPDMLDYVGLEARETVEILAEPMRYAPQGIQHVPMPTNGIILNSFYEIVKAVFALLFLLMYMYPTFTMVASFVEEKETKVREVLRMMGVESMTILCSWFVLYIGLFAVLNVMLTITAGYSVFEFSSNSVVFVLLTLYTLSAISFSYFIHVFFDKARTGGIAGALIFNCCYFVYAATFDFSAGNVKAAGTLKLCLLSPAAFAYGISLLCSYEESTTGVHWDTISNDIGAGLTMFEVLYMLLFDSVLYTVMGWYLEQVLPKEFGVTKPWYFPVEALIRLAQPPIAPLQDIEVPTVLNDGRTSSSENIEDVSMKLRQQEQNGNCVIINGLRKVFSTPDGPKVAVDGLNVIMYEGQIFVLLGHNGAGKTTTINMLTGLYEPSAGDAFVHGRKISTEMEAIRKCIGVCPQHDVLFSSLTCVEHLRIFGQLKFPDATEAQLEQQIAVLLAKVGLADKAGTKASALSGGMKRKLSLVVALIGESSVVFLDEPTSGMDPFSRRSTWKFLRSNRSGRCIVLTTHFMDEADLLADRIGIMSEGRLRCCGSSLFLKSRYGSGYSLAISKTANCQPTEITEMVSTMVAGSNLVSDVGTELRFQLPTSGLQLYASLFHEFDSNKEQLGISHYGVSVTTMEEVFLRVAEVSAADDQVEVEAQRSEFKFGKIDEGAVSAASEFTRHLSGLFLKRAQYGRRDVSSMLCTTILPVVLLLLGLLMLKFSQALWILKPVNQDLNQFVPRYADAATVPFCGPIEPDKLSTMPGQPPIHPIRVELDLSTSTGTVWGVPYLNGTALQAWAPRSDRQPDLDRRHRPANRVGLTSDSAEILAMSQMLLGQDLAVPDSKVFAAVVVSEVKKGFDICGASVITQDFGVAFSANPRRPCSMVLRAIPGKQLSLKFVLAPDVGSGWYVTIRDGDGPSAPQVATLPWLRSGRHGRPRGPWRRGQGWPGGVR